VVTRRTVQLLSVLDGWWARVLDRADVVSEGSRASEPPGGVYYGSTNLRCVPEPRPATLQKLGIGALARLMLADPHVRVRLVRLARREAVARAPGPLGVLRVEITAQPAAAGGEGQEPSSAIDVQLDVSAPVVDAAAGQERW
jgi:hypothetical protein